MFASLQHLDFSPFNLRRNYHSLNKRQATCNLGIFPEKKNGDKKGDKTMLFELSQHVGQPHDRKAAK